MVENDNNSTERDKRLHLLISKGAELAGGAAGPAVGTVIGSLLARPVGAAAVGTVGAGVTMAVKAIGQVDDEAVGLLLHSADDHQGLAEAALGVARRMGHGDEHLLGLAAMLPHVILDDGVLAVKPVLVQQPLEDALCRVALLPREPEIIIQDPVNDALLHGAQRLPHRSR